MRLLIIFILMLSNSFASDASDIKNLVINKELKNYSDITFLNIKNKELNLNDYKGNLVLLNFWATWCAPCKREMPSLEKLTFKYPEIKVFAVNTEKPNNPPSNLAIGGIYVFDETFWVRLDEVQDLPNFSISDVTKQYIKEGIAKTVSVGENTWIDCGTPESLLRAGQMVEQGIFTIKGAF